MSEHLSRILEQLQHLPDLGGFGNIIEAIRGVYDVDHVSYYALSLGLDAARHDYYAGTLAGSGGVVHKDGRRVAATSYSPDWIKRYVEAKFYASDPVVLGARQSFDPVDWNDLDWDDNQRRTFRGESVEHGVGDHGYSIPVRGPGGQFAVFTVNKSCTDADWRRLKAAHGTDFILLAHFAHQRVLTVEGHEHAQQCRQLSARESDAIRLIAEGLSRGQASERLGISENTFRVYIDSARHKLGALNIPHAIALAAHRGIIPPV